MNRRKSSQCTAPTVIQRDDTLGTRAGGAVPAVSQRSARTFFLSACHRLTVLEGGSSGFSVSMFPKANERVIYDSICQSNCRYITFLEPPPIHMNN